MNKNEKKITYVVETAREIGVGLVIGGAIIMVTSTKQTENTLGIITAGFGVLTLVLGYIILLKTNKE